MIKIYPKKEPRIPFTQTGYDELVAERKKLTAQRPEAVEHLRKSREMGDLSENGYYKASRAALSFLDSRLRRANRLIKLAVIVGASNNGVIQIGSTVKLTDGTRELELTVVGGYESDPAKHTISHQSPMGRAIMGKKSGDVATVSAPVGIKEYTITLVT